MVEAGQALQVLIVFFFGFILSRVLDSSYKKKKQRLELDKFTKEQTNLLGYRFDMELARACTAIINKILQEDSDEDLEAMKMRIETLSDELDDVLLERASKKD